MKILALILVVFLAACTYEAAPADPVAAPPTGPTIALALDMTALHPSQRPDVEAGLEAWRDALAAECGVALTWEEGERVLLHTVTEEDMITRTGEPHTGFTSRWVQNGDIGANVWFHQTDARTVIHEIGHVLGLKHTDREDSVMWEKSDQDGTVKPTKYDTETLCAQITSKT